MPRPRSLRPLEPIGTRLITSTPPARAESTAPLPTSAVARLVACCEEPHCVSTVVLATDEREAGAEPRGAADVEGLLADLAHAAGDDLADAAGSMPGALDGRLLHGGEQVGGVDGGEPAVALPDGRADGFDDHDIRHAGNLSAAQRRRPLAASSTRSRAEAPMKATKTEPRSSSSKVVELVAGGELATTAPARSAPRTPMAIVARQPRLGAPTARRARPAGEEPHDAPRRGCPCGGDASVGRLAGLRRRSGGGTGARGAAFAASAARCGGEGGLEGCPGLGDASTARLTGGFVDPPGRRAVEEGELTCHAH